MAQTLEANAAVVFPRPREVTLEQRPRPRPGPGQVVVRSRASLISPGTEVTILSGSFEPGSAWAAYGVFPFDPGYSNVGVVVDAADDVDPSWVGRTVASYAPHATYGAVPTGVLRPVPDAVPVDQATLFTLAETVMNGLRRSRLTWGETIVVFGAGLLGQLAARLAVLAGARHVVVVDVSAPRLGLLPRSPVVTPVQPLEEEPRAALLRATGGRLADVVVELTGDPALLPAEVPLLRPQGRFVVLSSPRGAGTQFNFHDLCNAPSIEIIGAHADSSPPVATPADPWTRPRHAELFFDLLAAGLLEVASLITRRVPYTEAPDVYRAYLAGSPRDLGVVLDWPDAD